MSEVTEVKTKKQIPERTAIKAIITSYVCYGLITFFIYNLLKSSISSLLVQSIEKNLPVLGYIIPTMFGIITLLKAILRFKLENIKQPIEKTTKPIRT